MEPAHWRGAAAYGFREQAPNSPRLMNAAVLASNKALLSASVMSRGWLAKGSIRCVGGSLLKTLESVSSPSSVGLEVEIQPLSPRHQQKIVAV
jgi:hypothetical protein